MYTTKYVRWYAEEREHLFDSFMFVSHKNYNNSDDIIAKIPDPIFISIYNKIKNNSTFFYKSDSGFNCLYNNTPINWIRSHTFVPYFTSQRIGESLSTQLKPLFFKSDEQMKVGSSILNSSLFFIWWIANSDCYHLNQKEIRNFCFDYNNDNIIKRIAKLEQILSEDVLKNSKRRVYNYKTSGRVEYDEFYMKKSKPIIDEVDKVLAKHYGLTEEELDFIINYDIKYRMGSELEGEE